MGMIFDIQRFSLNDGPGIRTTVFLKGCPLRCQWCHNPESWSKEPQLSYDAEKCIGCGKCTICPNSVHHIDGKEHIVDFAKCKADGACVQICSTRALRVYGYESSVDEVIEFAAKDIAYYNASGGGITISGGEPMAQPEFTLELLKKAKTLGIGTAIETSGYAKTEHFCAILPYVDWFLYDYKADSEHHKTLTGVDNTLIVKNLSFLCANHAKIILRCPIVPGINENKQALDAFVGRLYGISSVELLPYHSMGKIKAKRIGLISALPKSADEDATKR